MAFDWKTVLGRYENGAEVDPIAGSRKFVITGADDTQIFFEARLWKDVLPRDHLERAIDMLEAGDLHRGASTFLEGYRLQVEKDQTVPQGCSRIPNMVAVVLQDLGMLDRST